MSPDPDEMFEASGEDDPADHAEEAEEAEEAEQRWGDTAHREHISRWFYPVSPQMHRGLAEMYVADPRFTATYDAVAPGLATYLHDAVLALYSSDGS